MTQSIVLFDDACRKCSRWAAFVDKRNPGDRLRTMGQETDEGRELLKARPSSLKSLDSVFIITEDGRWYARSTAIWRIASRMSLPWSFGVVIWFIPRPIRDLFYGLYARHR
jgi:predicted DCC family thiol-disulfide oxidoreductase YuxK